MRDLHQLFSWSPPAASTASTLTSIRSNVLRLREQLGLYARAIELPDPDEELLIEFRELPVLRVPIADPSRTSFEDREGKYTDPANV